MYAHLYYNFYWRIGIMDKIVNKQLIEVLNKVNSDSKLLEGFSKCKSINEMYDFCQNISTGYTFQEFEDCIMSIANELEEKVKKGEIAEDDLKNISGGKGTESESMSRSLAMVGVAGVNFLGSGMNLASTIMGLKSQRDQAKLNAELQRESLKLQERQIALQERQQAFQEELARSGR